MLLKHTKRCFLRSAFSGVYTIEYRETLFIEHVVVDHISGIT